MYMNKKFTERFQIHETCIRMLRYGTFYFHDIYTSVTSGPAIIFYHDSQLIICF